MKKYNNEIKIHIFNESNVDNRISNVWTWTCAQKMWLNHPDELISDRIGICVRKFHAIAQFGTNSTVIKLIKASEFCSVN